MTMFERKLLLNNKKIILTRSFDNISQVKHLLESQGATTYDLPALSIQYPDDLSPLDDALYEINNFHWIIFSSIIFIVIFIIPYSNNWYQFR